MTLEQFAAAVRIPNYWEDPRYGGREAWHMADSNYANETAWWESTPAGYNGQDIFDDGVIAAQEATYDQQNVVAPQLL